MKSEKKINQKMLNSYKPDSPIKTSPLEEQEYGGGDDSLGNAIFFFIVIFFFIALFVMLIYL